MIKRRDFIASSLAAFSCGAVPCPKAFAGCDGLRLRAGIISDTHVRGLGWSVEPLVAALKWYDAQKVDAVVIAGDLTDFGLVEELRVIGQAWDDIFPGNKASDGRTVEKIFVTGNHDYRFYNHPAVQKKYPDKEDRYNRSIAKNFDAAWRECFHEPYEAFFVKEVKGYSFVGANYGERGLAKFFEKVKGRFADKSKPFFYVQHQHLRNTCHGPHAWGQDKGESVKVLEKFPNAIAFSGHSHYSLTDEKCVWQGSFTSVGTASLKYVTPTAGVDYENGTASAEGRVRQMPGLAWSRAKHALLMDVFDDRVVLSRWAAEQGVFESLGDAWVLPQPFREPPPFSFATRADKVACPQFAPSDRVAVKVIDGELRNKQKVRQVELRFPEASAGGRVFDYEVRAIPLDAAKNELVRHVLSPSFHLSKRAYATACCRFGMDELPGPCRFTVTPRSSFARTGKAICGLFDGEPSS